MSNTKFLEAVHKLSGTYNPNDPTTKPRGALTTFYLEQGKKVPIWLDPSTMVDSLCERKVELEESLVEQLRGFFNNRRAVARDKDRVRKEFKSLIRNLERDTQATQHHVDAIQNRLKEHIRLIDRDLKTATSPERKNFLKSLRVEYQPLLEEASSIVEDSRKFEKDARTREKIYKKAMDEHLFDRKIIEETSLALPILRDGVISGRIVALNAAIDDLVDESAVQGEVFKKAEEYEPIILKALKCVAQTRKHYPDHLTSAEPKILEEVEKQLDQYHQAFQALKQACAAPETAQASPEVEEERQMALYELTSKIDQLIGDVVRHELNVSELPRVERQDRREAIEEVRNALVDQLYLAFSASEDISELKLDCLIDPRNVSSSGSKCIDAQRRREQEQMIKDYANIQHTTMLAIEYGSKLSDILQAALGKLPVQCTNREKSLLKTAVKGLVTQAHIEAVQAQKVLNPMKQAKPKYRLNQGRVRKLVDLWKKHENLDQLQSQQSHFFDKLLAKGVKYKNIWVDRRREISLPECNTFSDFAQEIFVRDGYDIPGVDLDSGKVVTCPGSKERVQELLEIYPKFFEDCVSYVEERVDVSEMPRNLQNEYVGLLIAYLLEQNTVAQD